MSISMAHGSIPTSWFGAHDKHHLNMTMQLAIKLPDKFSQCWFIFLRAGNNSYTAKTFEDHLQRVEWEVCPWNLYGHIVFFLTTWRKERHLVWSCDWTENHFISSHLENSVTFLTSQQNVGSKWEKMENVSSCSVRCRQLCATQWHWFERPVRIQCSVLLLQTARFTDHHWKAWSTRVIGFLIHVTWQYSGSVKVVKFACNHEDWVGLSDGMTTDWSLTSPCLCSTSFARPFVFILCSFARFSNLLRMWMKLSKRTQIRV